MTVSNQFNITNRIFVFYSALLIVGFQNLVNPANAAIETYPFDTKQQEQDYHILIDELRCLVCQNQNLADSNAELAQDLRKQVHTMLVEQNQDKQAIVQFMVDRYGDFVLYNPPVKYQTYLLWTGPFIFLLLGFWWLFRVISKANKDQLND